MRKNRFLSLLLTAAMMAAAATSLTACHDDDATDPNPLAKQVSGLWWALSDQEGTYGTGEYAFNYTRIGQAVNFNEDGTGYGVTFLFGDESGEPVVIIGGQKLAPFTYASTADGRITANFADASQRYADYFSQWTMTYAGGTVTATDGTTTLTLEHPSDQMAAQIEDWDLANSDGGNAAIDDSGFNPNDPDFTRTNWRNEQGIYLYDGTGEYSFTQGSRTAKFSLVPLPWYEGTKFTNLPDHFCDDVTPENGWELVLNLCGNTKGNLRNNNFFALYNKYTGILRFFYYMPEGFNAGNDHVWQVSMTDHLAQHSLWLYGLPSDRILTNKAAVGQSGTGTFMEYVTPWVDYLSQDGLITPNAGWWAFDVDLSQYRPDDDISADNIKLQMRSWEKHTTSLYSTMTADIDGTLKANLKLDQVPMKSSSTAKGVLMGLQAAASAGSTIANFYSSNWAAGLTSLSSTFGTVSQMVGLGSGGPTGYTGSVDGTISLGLNGAINTDGAIDGSKATTGIPSPTIYLKDFDLKNSHVGQGVWNLKTPPVVYNTNFKFQDNWFAGQPYFFDPNSIEVELNPSVFPESEIEWMQVDALCFGRKCNQVITMSTNEQLPTDEIRLAFGLNKAKYNSGDVENMPRQPGAGYFKGVMFDFLYAHEDKLGLKEEYYLEKEYYLNDLGNHIEYIVGRGDNDMAIEPQYYAVLLSRSFHVPFIEVNVKVFVKMKGMEQPVVLSRNYLPEIKDWSYGIEFEKSLKKTRPYASKMKGHTDLYDYQMKRIYDIIDRYGLADIDLSGYNYLPLSGTGGTGSEGYTKLFDSKTDTKWATSEKKDGKWFVEFVSKEPINVTSYGLTTANDTKSYPGRNPKSWKVYGKLNEGDQWTLLDSRTNGNLPADNYKESWFSCSHMKCQYFRFEISEIVSGNFMQLAEFEFDPK